MEPIDDSRRLRRAQPKQDHANAYLAGRGDDIGEIEVEAQNDAILGHGFGQHGLVVELLKPELAQMHSIVPLRPQPGSDPSREVHVEQEAHGSGGHHLLTREPGRISQGLPDVLRLEVRIGV